MLFIIDTSFFNGQDLFQEATMDIARGYLVQIVKSI